MPKANNRSISVHLQDFPDVSFLQENEKLVANMDFVRAICSAALSLRDNKNLRVRLPLAALKIIGKNAARALDFKDIIADEVNVKNIIIEENLTEIAELKLQINFKKIGAKYGAKVKQITDAMRAGDWKKISENEIEIAGVRLIDDEFEIKLDVKNIDGNKFAIIALPTNDCLVALDIEVTQDLQQEGIARDIVRAIQQTRKDANLNVSDYIAVKIFSKNNEIANVLQKFSTYICEQVLATKLEFEYDENKAREGTKFNTKMTIDDGELVIGVKRQVL